MPTVDDAIKLLTDPANRTMGSSAGPWVEMRPPAVIGGLQDLGADEDAARLLAVEALEAIGGRHEIERVQDKAAMGSGMWGNHHAMIRLWVPRARLRT